MDYTDPTAFAEVYSLTTGRKQTVPRAWLGDPVLGRDFRKTPSQRELDGDLPTRPHESDTVKEIDAYADAAGIDLAGASTKPDKVATIDAAFTRDDNQEGLDPIVPDPAFPDPLAPALVAHTDQPPVDDEPATAPVDDQADTTPDDPDSDPSTGDTTQEN